MGLFGFGSSGVLFWPGCYSSAALGDAISAYRRILKKIGIKFETINSLMCCGGVLIDAGYDKEARKLARENFELLKEKGIKKIVTDCPLCYKTLSQDYKEFIPEWDIQAEFILATVLNQLKYSHQFRQFRENQKLSIPTIKIAYRDSCILGRGCGIYELPRELLKLLGYDIVELLDSREDSICCGTCGNLKQTNPGLAKQIALDFIKQLKRTGADKLVTADPAEYSHLKENLNAGEISLFDFSDILCKAFDIQK